MNVNQLIDGHSHHTHARAAQAITETPAAPDHHGTWQANTQIQPYKPSEGYASLAMAAGSATSPQRLSYGGSYAGNHGLSPKQVTFEYLLTEGLQQRARLPMRVNIYPHDGTDSIITTVKNFYGLYDGNGVSFEDKDGCTLIARYENFQDQMVVYVRVVDTVGSDPGTPRTATSPRRPRLGPPFQMALPESHGQSISRPSSRSTKNRSPSPQLNRSRRSQSASTNPKSRPRPLAKSRNGSTHGSVVEHNVDVDMSDSDGANASVTSSRRGKIDVVASAEISVDNIVEGGRRKRARFDSSVRTTRSRKTSNITDDAL